MNLMYKACRHSAARPVQRLRSQLFKILAITILIYGGSLGAQVSIYGVVRDSSTKSILPFANIRIKGTTKGVTASENGSFKINADSVPLTLIVTFIGYRTREVDVQKPYSSINVFLAPSNKTLSEVVISSDPVRCIQDDRSLHASDFEFYDNYILLLAHKDQFSPSRLILSDESGKTVSTLLIDGIKAESLYRDCFGNVHLLSKDSAWQVYYDYVKLQLLYPITLTDLERNLYPCQLYHKGKVFMSFRTFHDQRNLYYVGIGGVNTRFFYCCDTIGTTRIVMNYDMRYFLNKRRRGEGYHYSVRFIKEHLTELQSGVALSTADSLSLTKLNAPLVQHENQVWIFNFSSNLAYRFNEQLSVADSVNIGFRVKNNSADPRTNSKDWTGELLRDEVTDKLYSVYKQRSITSLALLNNNDFTVEKVSTIEDKPFPKELKVRNGVLYFLWLDSRNSHGNRKLYRMYLHT